MKEKQLVLIDLDGTVTNPEEGIKNAIRYALEHMALVPLTDVELRRFIGPPLAASFREIGLSEIESVHAVALYREYFSVKGLYENHLYPNMSQILGALAETKTLALATSKPEDYARQIVDYFNVSRYFDNVYGSREGMEGSKGEIIRYALSHYPRKKLKHVMMIGDRAHDVIGATENQIESMGVLYGFGTLSELTYAQVTIIAKQPDDILRLLS